MSTEITVNDSELVEPPVVQGDRRRSEWLMTLREAWHMRRTKIGGGIFGFIVLLAVVGPWVAPYSPTEFVAPPFSAPAPPTTWLGSDYIGHDVLTRVLYVKQTATKKFAIVDAGMNDLIRPALYQSFHEIVPVAEPACADTEKVDVVGPVCESGDFFAQDRALPPLAQGDVIALMSAGAYGATMSSNYNSRPLSAEVLVSGERFAVIRARQTPEDLVRGESLPQW